jgi:hypothetical protein
MVCLSLAFWENLAIDVVILIAVVALLRLLIVALGGGAPGAAFWPPVTNPMAPGPSPSGLLGFIAAALNIVIWAVILIFIIYVIFALLSCLVGGVGGFGWRPLR